VNKQKLAQELVCHVCGARQVHNATADNANDIWGECLTCTAMLYVVADDGQPRVVVGCNSRDTLRVIGDVLHPHGFFPLPTAHGEDVLRITIDHCPAALILDVGIERMLSYQVVELVRGYESAQADEDGQRRARQVRELPIILLASVYSKTAYKGRPKSLYGANDYIELHHVPDSLIGKLRDLAPQHFATVDGNSSGEPGGDGHAVWVAGRRATMASGAGISDLVGAARARALAHSIVADIALYHEQAVRDRVRGIESEPLQRAIDDGRRFFAANVPERDCGGADDPVGDAFAQLIAAFS